MKTVILSILAALITTSSYANDDDRYDRQNNRWEENNDYDDDHDERYEDSDRYRADDRHGYGRGNGRGNGRHGRGHRHHANCGHNNQGGGYYGGGYQGGGYYPPPHQQQYGVQFVQCDSYDGRQNACFTGMRAIRRVDVVRQYSHAPCIQGRTFGIRGNAIVVAYGCRATFRVEGIR